MKRLLSLLLCGCLLCATFAFGGCADRSEQLKMYVPGEYIDPDLLDEFEDWYLERTGKKVEVITPDTFDVVEEILIRVEKDRADYDLLCPSDYAVERLLNRGLLQEIDPEIVDVENTFKQEYLALTEPYDPDHKYAVPYMYGTFGLMYDYSKTGEHVDSWDALFTDRFGGRAANKDSMREALTSAAIYRDRAELSRLSNGFTDYNTDYQNRLQSLFEDTADDTLDGLASTLVEMLHYARVWGGESLKFDMAGNNTGIEVALMWSCDAGYVMNDYEDDNGDEHPGNRNMWYVVPKEGGNIYLDCFVISKYAKNPTAANYFLQFISQKETALRSSDYAGAISPVAEAYDELYDDYTSEDSKTEYIESFEDEDLGRAWFDMYIDMLFPSPSTRNRCGIMRDYGDRDAAMSIGWLNVRYR